MTQALRILSLIAVILCIVTTPVGAATTSGPVADANLGTSQVSWTPHVDHAGLHLVVSGPEGIHRVEFAPGDPVAFDLAALDGDIDGLYTWELRATPKLDAETTAALSAMRTVDAGAVDRQRPAGLPPADSLVQSGTFRVLNGAIVQPAQEDLSPDLRVQGAGDTQVAAGLGVITGEQVISGDLTVYNSLCVGFDCLSNETYGADTIRLKENNLRIHVDDTSTAGSFPRTDWRLEFNSNLNGGGSYFKVIDASANRQIMTLEAGAPSHSLYVDSGGRVGIGTQNPVIELHVSNGDSPGLRLEQNTSSGFAAQVWDLAGNETSFFLRDATNGSTLPFRVFPGSSSGILVVRDDNVGVGTISPDAKLDVVRTASGNAELLKLTNDGPIDFVFERADVSNSDWRFEAENVGFFISRIGSGSTEFNLANNGDLEIAGDLTANGTNYPSSRVLKENFSAVDSRDILQRLAAVPVSLWNYRTDTDKQPHIGPVTEDFSQAFDFLHIDGKLNTIDLHGVAMAAIQGLNEEIQVLNRQVEDRDARISEMEQRLAALETLLSDGVGSGGGR